MTAPRYSVPLTVSAGDVAWLMPAEPELADLAGGSRWLPLVGVGVRASSSVLYTPPERTFLAANAPVTVRLAITSAGWSRPVEIPGRLLTRLVRPGWLLRHQLTWWRVVELVECSGECPHDGRCSGALRLHCNGRPVTQTHIDLLEYQEVCLPAATPVPAGPAGTPGPNCAEAGPGTPVVEGGGPDAA